ncbi:MAG: trehalose 6-phosphate synthase [Desulfovibrionaceae bacterium]|nr:trehalose 6-phosphate synthase [Desulfovibrionaceae bacterium]
MEISSLKDFYRLMARTREVRAAVVSDLLAGHAPGPGPEQELSLALAALSAIPPGRGPRTLALDRTRTIEIDLGYEIGELEKDLFYLGNGEQAFLERLAAMHPGFKDQVNEALGRLAGIRFNCFVTDRDGTTNNYCGRYRSSIQSAYNAVFLSRFAGRAVTSPIIMTSAPLRDFGLLDVSANPQGTFIYAASKGRECLDLAGLRRSHPIDPARQAVLEALNQRLSKLIARPDLEKFGLIGSGLQFKFGQTTIARQDITGSVPEGESLGFLETIRSLVAELDPAGANLRIEDTGLDLEIILTIEAGDEGLKDFDKGDGVKYLDRELGLGMARGPNLVCGDTSSDLAMVRAAMELSKDTWSVFVTVKQDLAARARDICPRALTLPEPDMLVTALGLLPAGRLL